MALKFLFKASNNEFEYEAILACLKIVKDLGAKQMVVYNDSSVVVGQILGQNATKEDHMAAYLVKAQAAAQGFRAQNSKADGWPN